MQKYKKFQKKAEKIKVSEQHEIQWCGDAVIENLIKLYGSEHAWVPLNKNNTILLEALTPSQETIDDVTIDLPTMLLRGLLWKDKFWLTIWAIQDWLDFFLGKYGVTSKVVTWVSMKKLAKIVNTQNPVVVLYLVDSKDNPAREWQKWISKKKWLHYAIVTKMTDAKVHLLNPFWYHEKIEKKEFKKRWHFLGKYWSIKNIKVLKSLGIVKPWTLIKLQKN